MFCCRNKFLTKHGNDILRRTIGKSQSPALKRRASEKRDPKAYNSYVEGSRDAVLRCATERKLNLQFASVDIIPIRDGIDSRADFLGHELHDLARSTADELLEVEDFLELFFGDAELLELFVLQDAFEQIVVLALFLDDLARFHGHHADFFVEFLAVAAILHAFHNDVFGSHEREFSHDALFDDLRVDHEAVRHVFSDDEHRVHSEESFRNGEALVGAIVEGTFEPLHGLRNGGAVHQGHHETSEGANAFAAHRVALVSHGAGANLGLFERFFHFLVALHQAHVGRELVQRLSDGREHLVHAVVPLAGVGLAGDGEHTLEASLFGDHAVELHNLFFVAIEQVHETGLRTGRALHAAEREHFDEEVHFFQVDEEVLEPEAGALTHRGELGGLEVRGTELGHVLVFHRELAELVHHAAKTLAHDDQSLLHLDEVGVVAHESGSCAQVDDALCLRALHAVSVNVAHHVVTAALFFSFGNVKVDVGSVSLQFVHLFLSDGEAKFHFGFGQENPQLAPSLELVLRAEDETHFLRSITLNQRAFELITHFSSFF